MVAIGADEILGDWAFPHVNRHAETFGEYCRLDLRGSQSPAATVMYTLFLLKSSPAVINGA